MLFAKRPSLLSFWGDAIVQVEHYPSDQTTAPSETQINLHEERRIAGFPPQPSMIFVSSLTCQELCSKSLDLVELKE
jgi:hypothetical protein